MEIIEEVKGNGTQQHLYLQDLQPEDQFLEEQAAAVLSLVTDPQLKVRRSSHSGHMTSKEQSISLKLLLLLGIYMQFHFPFIFFILFIKCFSFWVYFFSLVVCLVEFFLFLY